MGPDKSDSFKFHRNTAITGSNCSDSRLHNCRRKLQDRFDKSDSASVNDRSVLSTISLNDTRRALKNGAEKVTKTFSNVWTTIGTISQKFKIPTKRRQILEEGPMTPNCDTPRTILGRTPTKLYSPFTIETPNGTNDKENQCIPDLEKTPSAPPSKSVHLWQRKHNLLDEIFK